MSLPPAFEPWWEQLSRFQLQYPDIQLQVYTTERCIDLIEDGIDVALRVGTITHEAMVVRRALEDRHLLVASAQPRSRRRRRDSAPPSWRQMQFARVTSWNCCLSFHCPSSRFTYCIPRIGILR
ncbi:TPA: LysR substrate-binding domain-containing protein [Stenotrophomonas maltophilia]|uniref:LysR substrate-binding domain-containing protein n=1 Tax=Stenotrophomonas maltophilia TaxID=40324 RepID=UPI0018D2BDD9|nr:hypothetical protein [Stenotrophomonas maltophilia]